MMNPFKFFVLCGISSVLITGCAKEESAKVAASVDQDFINAYDAFEMAKNPRAKVASGDTVSMSEGVWLGASSTLLEHRNNLPSQFETDTGITILLDEPVTLQVLANNITSITNIPVKIDSQVDADKLKKMNLLLNEFGLNIRFDAAKVTRAPDMSIVNAQQQAKIDRDAPK